ncbi:hypothetical protein COOONC_17465 [Cooperia oncophora]
MKYAEDLKAALHKVVIRSVTTVRERGVYAPMTSSGDLLANDIYVSCHNVVKTSTLFANFLDFATHVQRKIGHLPPRTEFFLNIIDHIIPTSSKMEL